MTIGGVPVPLTALRRADEAVGARGRAESGAHRSTVRAVKRGYEGTTAYLTAAEVAALRAAIGLDAAVTVDPSAEDGTAPFTAVVEVREAGFVNAGGPAGAGGVLQALTLAVTEV